MKKKAKAKRPPPRKKPDAEPAEENKRAPFCRVCQHRHFGAEHVWS